MFWADRIAGEIIDTRKPRDGKRFLVRDEKTMSGRVHIGSMRGVAIHGLVAEVLAEQGAAVEYRFEVNDFDPFDTVPGYLDAAYREHLGKPLYAVPSPEPGFANYAEFYAAEFISVHEKAGFAPSYYRATELYRAGTMDPFIIKALERASDVRRILKEVSGSEKSSDWLPFSVVCEKCGRLMTTRTYDYDGATIAYACDRSDEFKGCGYTSRVSPLGGTGKLFWKAEWAAKWSALGVDVEGGGKDHSTKGGARDVANHIAREIFGAESPFDIPYEFFLVGGKKMSSSKGRGSSAKDVGDLFPSQILRLALIGKDIREQIDIDPSGESVPRLYDWYDELLEHAREGAGDDYARLFALAQLPAEQAAPQLIFELRFREVAFILQMPHLSLEAEAARAKGSALSPEELRALKEREHYARFWLATYAPDDFKYELQAHLPTVELSSVQKKALMALAEYLAEPRTGEELHARLHEFKTEIPISPRDLFQAMYRIFLNRDSGPKAGWFLAGLRHDFVLKRLTEAAE